MRLKVAELEVQTGFYEFKAKIGEWVTEDEIVGFGSSVARGLSRRYFEENTSWWGMPLRPKTTTILEHIWLANH